MEAFTAFPGGAVTEQAPVFRYARGPWIRKGRTREVE
jgi:hypothetical protein